MLFVFLTFCCVGYSQTSSIQKGESKPITDEILRLEAIRIIDHQAFIVGLESLATKQSKMSAYQLCHFKFLKAYQVAFNGKTQKAIEDIEQIIPLCEDLRARIRMDALLANLNALSGDYSNASKYIDNTIQNVEQTPDLKTKAIAYTAASMVYNLLDQKQLSVKYSEILYALDPSTENKCRLQHSKNLYHLDGGKLDEVYPEINLSDNACIESGNDIIAQSILLDSIERKLASDILNKADIDELSQRMIELRPEIATGPYKNIQAQFAAIEAKFAYLKSDMVAAKTRSHQALAINDGLGNTEQLIMALEVLELVAKSEQDYEQAYEYLNRKNEAELGLYDQSQAKQMAFMTVKHTNLSKVFEIEQLNRQKIVLELEKKLANQETNNQSLVILLILTLLALMSLWLFKIKKKHDYFKDVSEIDHLTKVLTRKAFEEQLNAVLSDTKSKNITVHVAIMDLDYFKAVNDTHGHLIGDWVLKNVIYTCKQLVEAGMLMGRLGGEEFGVVMHGVNSQQMFDKIEAMRSAIEKLDTSASGVNLKVTASFGISNSSESEYDLAMLLTDADLAMFEAKNKGRNQTVVYHENMTPA